MKRAKAQLVFASLVVMMCVGFVAAQEKGVNVAGTWDMVQEGRNAPLKQTLTIQQTGSILKGSIKGPNDEIPISGNIAASKITFSLKFVGRNGEEIHDYEGSVAGDTMKGTMKVADRSIEWSAKKPTN